MPKQQSLDFFCEKPKPQKASLPQEPASLAQEIEKQPPTPAAPEEAATTKKRERKPHANPPVAPPNLPPSYFVSAGYDGKLKKAVIKLYEPQAGEMYFWYDNTGHLPYCLTSIAKEEMELFGRVKNHEGFDHFETVKRFDPLNDKEIDVTKIVCKDPQAVGGRPGSSIRDIIPEDFKNIFGVSMEDAGAKVWEARIKYYQSYIFDRKLLPGMTYEVKDGNLVEVVDNTASENLAKIRDTFKDCSEEERSYAEMWAKLLEYPAPHFRRAAMDIEVYSPLANRVPDPREGTCPVIACSIYSSDGDRKVLMLKREGVKSGDPGLLSGIDIEFCETEEELIRKVFDVLNDFPFILTFNGDDFDLRYLAHRAYNLGLKKSEIPIDIGKRVCSLHYGLHIDLYKFFFNRSVQVYAYGGKYKDVSLDDVGCALIGMPKLQLETAFG